MRLTYKFRLNPTKAQRTALKKSLEACRWVYNKTLEIRRDAWENEQRSVSLYDTNKLLPQWKKDKPELTNAFSQALQDAQKRVDLGFQAFYRRVKVKKEKAGYPRFQGEDRYNSFTYKQYGTGVKVLDNQKIRLSKIGDVKFKQHREMRGTPKLVTIQCDRLGNWYVCITCVVRLEPMPVTQESVGIDLGLTKFMVLSNGEVIERERWMKQDEKDLKRVQRKISRLAKGSAERRKAIRALNHIHRRIANRRKNYAHQCSRKIVNRFQFIAFEALNITGMQSKQGSRNRFKTITKGIADVAWGQVVAFTTYKAEYAGRQVVKVNPRGTTQECSCCGELVPKSLSVRIHDCSYCGLRLDRDHNAALNILGRGLSALEGHALLEAPSL